MSESKLKPCPFCGSEAVSVQEIDPSYYDPLRNHPCTVVCDECDLLFGFDADYGGRFDTKAEAIKAWNRRAKDE